MNMTCQNIGKVQKYKTMTKKVNLVKSLVWTSASKALHILVTSHSLFSRVCWQAACFCKLVYKPCLHFSWYTINSLIWIGVHCFHPKRLMLVYPYFTAVMGEYEPKIEVQFEKMLHVAKGSSVRLECFALGK